MATPVIEAQIGRRRATTVAASPVPGRGGGRQARALHGGSALVADGSNATRSVPARGTPAPGVTADRASLHEPA